MGSTRNAVAATLIGSVLLGIVAEPAAAWRNATPALAASCDAPHVMDGTPSPAQETHDMPMDAPTTEQTLMTLDQMYIDMMIPHHASIIAMAEAALPRLSDASLQEMAGEIIVTQEPEITELRELRQELVGEPDPMPMDDTRLAAMHQMMPDMSGDMEVMAFQMDADAQVAGICAAEDANLAFIDQTIPHHQMAIEASRALLAQSEHPKLRALAEDVIAAQQREIDELRMIREWLAVAATP